MHTNRINYPKLFLNYLMIHVFKKILFTCRHSLKFTALEILKFPSGIWKNISALYLSLESRVNASSTIIISFSETETETGNVCSSSRVWLSDLNTVISTCSGYSLRHRSDTCECCRNCTKFTLSESQHPHMKQY